MKKTNWLLAAALSATSLLPAQTMMLGAEEAEAGVFPVLEDAQVLANNPSANTNSVAVGRDFGLQYVSKNYAVLQTKNNGKAQAMSLMKFDVPSLEEIEANGWNEFTFNFHIFKNEYLENGPQIFHFYYAEDASWSEESVTWETKPEAVNYESAKLLFDYNLNDFLPREFLPEEDKIVKADITPNILDLAERGVKQITVFTGAEDSRDTTLMIHAKESELSASSITAARTDYNKDSLSALCDKANALNEGEYMADDWAGMKAVWKKAVQLLSEEEPDGLALKDVSLRFARELGAMRLAVDPEDPENIAYGKPTRSNLSKQETWKINDGKDETYWQGLFFPTYIDIDLMDEYALSDISLTFPEGKRTQYTIYASVDGKNYNTIYDTDTEVEGSGPFVNTFNGEKARIVRVYLKYTENESSAWLNEVRIHGDKTNESSMLDARSLRQL